MYPVDKTSRSVCFNSGAVITCCPISISGFLPDINDKNNIASAFSLTCIAFPGNKTTGIELFDLIVNMLCSKELFINRLPPTKK